MWTWDVYIEHVLDTLHAFARKNVVYTLKATKPKFARCVVLQVCVFVHFRSLKFEVYY